MPDQPSSSPEDALNDFLKSVERRAFKRAAYAVRDDDAALDIVQDTMIRLSQSYADRPTESADDSASRAETLAQIEEEINKLPARQREAFLLRYWEEFDVAETAASMGCSEGSVKTHCSRAVHALAQSLQSRGISL